jgi:hypothetical protein
VKQQNYLYRVCADKGHKQKKGCTPGDNSVPLFKETPTQAIYFQATNKTPHHSMGCAFYAGLKTTERSVQKCQQMCDEIAGSCGKQFGPENGLTEAINTNLCNIPCSTEDGKRKWPYQTDCHDACAIAANPTENANVQLIKDPNNNWLTVIGIALLIALGLGALREIRK